jgi:Concanavalin A-like lectin/glucanases superfamily
MNQQRYLVALLGSLVLVSMLFTALLPVSLANPSLLQGTLTPVAYLPLIRKEDSTPTPTTIPSVTPTATPTSQPSGPPFGNVLRLDGTDDYATASDSSDLDIGDEAAESLTVEAWFLAQNVDPSSYSGEITIAEKTGSYQLFIAFNLANQFDCVGMRLFARLGSADQLACDKPFTPGWHHVAGVFNRANGQASLYLDGRFMNQFSFGSALVNSTSGLYIGGVEGSATGRFAGSIEELRISATARYTGLTYPIPGRLTCDPETRALWHFDEAAGSTTMYDGEDGSDASCGAVEDTLTGQNGAATGP